MADSTTTAKAHHVPPGTANLGLTLLLMSLTVLFGASMVGYLIVRLTSSHAPDLQTLEMPAGLWVSTVVILVSSFTVHQAVRAAKADRPGGVKTWITVTFALAIAFVAIQAPNMYHLLQVHEASRELNIFLYGLVVLLIALHALHVVGGFVPLAIVTTRSFKQVYGKDNVDPVKRVARYWHFLDIVWVTMFLVMFLVG
jgi:heme/copper-type cytochrome/quinol oxidase subunit 3